MDKNGRVVTRHVRVDGPDSGESREFPSPKVIDVSRPGAIDVPGMVKETRKHIKDVISETKLGFFEKRKLMSTLDSDTLAVIAKHGIGGDGDKIPSLLIARCVADGEMKLLNDFADYIDDHGVMKTRHGYGHYDTCLFLLGLRGGKCADPSMDDFGFSPYSEASAEEREAQHAVIEAALTLGGVDHVVYEEAEHSIAPIRRLRSYALVEYIKENPDKAEEVVKLIKDRGISSLNDGLKNIEELMDARDDISAPLSEGTL
jgi:hypothetical protein